MGEALRSSGWHLPCGHGVTGVQEARGVPEVPQPSRARRGEGMGMAHCCFPKCSVGTPGGVARDFK